MLPEEDPGDQDARRTTDSADDETRVATQETDPRLNAGTHGVKHAGARRTNGR